MIKRFLAGLLLFSANALAEAPRSVDAVLADYAKASGGLAAVDAIGSRKITGSMGLRDKAELYWAKPDKVLLLANNERTGYNGQSGWIYSKKKKLRRLKNGQQMPLEMDANPLRYVHLRQLYSEINAAPQKTFDDTLMDVLVAPNDLARTVFYFDAHTHLLAAIEEKGDTSAYFTQSVWFEDYKLVDGIQFPYRITHKSTDKTAGSEEFKVKSVENNFPVDAEVFSKPQSMKLVSGGKR